VRHDAVGEAADALYRRESRRSLRALAEAADTQIGRHLRQLFDPFAEPAPSAVRATVECELRILSCAHLAGRRLGRADAWEVSGDHGALLSRREAVGDEQRLRRRFADDRQQLVSPLRTDMS
jgi:hypothetical protein